MFNITNENYTGTLTSRCIIAEAINRGWKISSDNCSQSQFTLSIPGGKDVIIFSSMPPTTSIASQLLAEDKSAFYEMFRSNTVVPMPETIMASSMNEGMVKRLEMKNGYRVVVKPLNGAHGNGITTNIDSGTMLETALKRAFKMSSKVLIQQHIKNSYDLRVLVIDGKVRAALKRIPAAVTGDGKSTALELIVIENNSENRGSAYSKSVSKIKLSAAMPYLGSNVSYVPVYKERFQVVGVANIGAGGTTMDVTDDLPEWLNELAVYVCAQMKLSVAGVDILLSSPPSATSSQSDLEPYVLEVNTCPSLFIHESPISGKSHPVVSDYVDYIHRISINST